MKYNIKTDLLFYIFFMLIAMFIAYNPSFGIVDDHTMTETLLIKKNIPLSIMPDVGRYFPLNAQEFNILTIFFSPSPQIFYIFNMLCFIVVILFLYRTFCIIFKTSFNNVNLSAYLAVSLIVVSPAFVLSWLRLFIPERMEFVFLCIFFHSYILLYTNSTQNRKIHIILCIVSSCIALFYKETAFVLLGVFSLCHITFCYIVKRKIFKVDYLVLINCLLWVLFYIIFILLERNGNSGWYGDNSLNRTLVLLQTFASHAVSDPIVVGTLFIFLFRFFEIVIKKNRISPLYDSMVVSVSVFVCIYIYLGLSGAYYMLPAYLFAVPLLFHFFVFFYRKMSFRIFCVCIFIIFISNSIPLSIYTGAFRKFVPQNLQKSLIFLKNYSKDKKLTLYLEGIDYSGNSELFASLQKWMDYYEINNVILSPIKAEERIKKKGDVIVLTPYTRAFTDFNFINKMKEEYVLLYEADSGFNIPFFGLQVILKKIWISFIDNRKDFVVASNIYRLPLFFYFFEDREI